MLKIIQNTLTTWQHPSNHHNTLSEQKLQAEQNSICRTVPWNENVVLLLPRTFNSENVIHISKYSASINNLDILLTKRSHVYHHSNIHPHKHKQGLFFYLSDVFFSRCPGFAAEGRDCVPTGERSEICFRTIGMFIIKPLHVTPRTVFIINVYFTLSCLGAGIQYCVMSLVLDQSCFL